jgi:hypothetical protein
VRRFTHSTKSLICFALTPNVNYEYNNLTGVAQPDARFTARAVITIQNEVLDDPTLIDSNTGLPYGGKLTLPLSTSESRSIAPGEREQKSMFLSRHCIGGLVSKLLLRHPPVRRQQGQVAADAQKNRPGGVSRPALFISAAHLPSNGPGRDGTG